MTDYQWNEARDKLKNAVGFDINFLIGTPKLREKYSYIDEWHSKNDMFNPAKMIAEIDEGGYDWSYEAVFKNKNNTFAFVWGAGCSCNGLETCDVEVFPDIDSLLSRLKHDQRSDLMAKILEKFVKKKI